MHTASVKQTSVDPKEKASVNQNQDLGSSTDIYVSNVDIVVLQNQPPSSTYVQIVDKSFTSSIRMSIMMLACLCILLAILYAACFRIKLRKLEQKQHLF